MKIETILIKDLYPNDLSRDMAEACRTDLMPWPGEILGFSWPVRIQSAEAEFLNLHVLLSKDAKAEAVDLTSLLLDDEFPIAPIRTLAKLQRGISLEFDREAIMVHALEKRSRWSNNLRMGTVYLVPEGAIYASRNLIDIQEDYLNLEKPNDRKIRDLVLFLLSKPQTAHEEIELPKRISALKDRWCQIVRMKFPDQPHLLKCEAHLPSP